MTTQTLPASWPLLRDPGEVSSLCWCRCDGGDVPCGSPAQDSCEKCLRPCCFTCVGRNDPTRHPKATYPIDRPRESPGLCDDCLGGADRTDDYYEFTEGSAAWPEPDRA